MLLKVFAAHLRLKDEGVYDAMSSVLDGKAD